MNIYFLGGADEVGASSILIEIGERRLLIDAGIRPSPGARSELASDQLPDLSQLDHVGRLDAILVTHAHTDHTGALELVHARFPDAPVYATPVTIALTRVLHQDGRRIMQTRLEEEGELPLYDDVAVARLMNAFQPVNFGQRVQLAPGLSAIFFPAGHIVGAAMIGLESDEGRILITGDVSMTNQRTVNGAKPPPFRPDVLVVESTYGGRLHANRAVEERRLVATIAEVIGLGGKVLIPAFALGRAQELLLTLAEFQRSGELAPIPIWADGMVRAICQTYSSFREALPVELQARETLFFDELIQPIERASQRNDVLWQPEPLVIISSSGMLAGGPSLHYARGLIRHPQHAILFTGYQDEESPGGRLQKIARRGYGTIQVGASQMTVRCRLASYALSAHADEGQLVSLIETLDPAHVFLVHGGAAARQSLANALHSRGRLVHQPQAGQSFDLRFTPRTAPGVRAIGGSRPLHLRRLWEAFSQDAPLYLTQQELAAAWWGDRPAPQQMQTLAAALAQDKVYFTADAARPGVFRVHPPAQVQAAERRRERMASLSHAPGQWLLIYAPDGRPAVVHCLALGADHLEVTVTDEDAARWEDDDERKLVRPEQVLGLLGAGEKASPELTAQLLASLPHQPQETIMESNQALVVARQQLPEAARLRKTGYRLLDRVLVLTFDFPDTATIAFADEIASIEEKTGWVVEITPEANQGALAALVKELLPAGWQILKEPSIFRQERRVTLTVAAPFEATPTEIEARFASISGYKLELALMAQAAEPQRPATPAIVQAKSAPVSEVAVGAAAQPGDGGPTTPMEINAAYALIRSELMGSTLYRVGLRDDGIMLSFISQTVGNRYQAQIEQLAVRTGYRLSVNPQPNQGTVVEAARALFAREGLAVQKGPSIFPEHNDVRVTLAAPLSEHDFQRLTAAFAEETGFRLRIQAPRLKEPEPPPKPPPVADLQLSPSLIHLSAVQQGITLNPEKLNRIIGQVMRRGVHPPLQVRRTRHGYALVDGLYRLRAAQALGLTRVPVEIVETPL